MARPYKRGDRWRIQWLDADGHRQSKTFLTERAAEHFLRKQQVATEEIRAGIRKPQRQEHTFGELCDLWIERRVPKKRSGKDDLSIIGKHLRPAFGSYKLDRITVVEIETFEDSLSVSPKTVHNILTLLLSLLNFAKRYGWIDDVPDIEKPTLSDIKADFRYLRTQEDIVRFLTAAKADNETAYVLYATAVYTGMREGELATLLWEDIDLDSRIISVRRSYNGPTKGNYIRKVPIFDPLLPLLIEWRRKNPLDIVFPNQVGKVHVPGAYIFQSILHRTLKNAGFPETFRNGKVRSYITFHDLRHTFASHWVMRGGDLFKLQEICGWKSHAMVRRYVHLNPDVYRADYARMGNCDLLMSGSASFQ